MQELIDITFSMANIIPTALLLFVVVYWIIVIVGAIDMDFLDIDLDMDVELETDLDIDAEGHIEISWFNNVLTFFNLSKIPLMVFLTFVAIPLWFILLNLNHFLGNSSFLLGFVFFVPTFIVCLFIAKFLTLPFVKIFAALNKGTRQKNILGRVCEVTLPASFTMKGQAEIDADGSHILIYIKSIKEETELKSGQTVLVIEKDHKEECYLVEPYEHFI